MKDTDFDYNSDISKNNFVANICNLHPQIMFEWKAQQLVTNQKCHQSLYLSLCHWIMYYKSICIEIFTMIKRDSETCRFRKPFYSNSELCAKKQCTELQLLGFCLGFCPSLCGSIWVVWTWRVVSSLLEFAGLEFSSFTEWAWAEPISPACSCTYVIYNYMTCLYKWNLLLTSFLLHYQAPLNSIPKSSWTCKLPMR